MEKLKIGEKTYRQLPVEVKSIDKEAGTLEAIFSTQDVDRHGDVVMQDGWDLKNFKKNPVILNSHNYNDAADVIGKASNVRIEGKKLLGDITFAVSENPKAKVIFDLYAGGFLNAFSVGFIPKKFKENKDGTRDWYTIEESELLEVSAVSVPANARALAKAKGIDIDALELKDNSNNDEENNNNEAGKDDEVPPADGESPADNGDNSESKPEDGDEEAGADAGDSEDQDIVPEEDNEEVDEDEAPEFEPAKEPEKLSFNSKVIKAIHNIESKENRKLRMVSNIIAKLLDGDTEHVRLTSKVKKQVRNRNINKAIRMLIEAR